MIRKAITLSIMLFAALISGRAQQAWSLEECIQYAMENNIQIKQSVLNTEYNENLLKQSKLGQIPNLNANGNYTFSWGRVLDQTTYRYRDNQQSNSISMGFSSSANLFQGLRVRNTIAQNNLNLMASYQDVEKIKNDISLNIAAAYLSIMFNRELLAVTENQLGITGQQVERTGKMVDAGKLAKGNLLELQAQYAGEELNLVNAENQLAISLLNLQQILDLPIDTTFDVVIPELADPDEDPLLFNALEVYRIAETAMPEIKSAELNMESTEQGLKIAKGGRSPQLYVSANYNTGFSDLREQVTSFNEGVSIPIGVTAGGEAVVTYPQNIPIYGAYPFFDQIRENLNGRDGQPIVFGVCVTLAKRMGIETWITRAIAIVATLFFTFFTVAVYILLGFLLSETNERATGFFRGLKVWLQECWDKVMDHSPSNGHGRAPHS